MAKAFHEGRSGFRLGCKTASRYLALAFLCSHLRVPQSACSAPTLCSISNALPHLCGGCFAALALRAPSVLSRSRSSAPHFISPNRHFVTHASPPEMHMTSQSSPQRDRCPSERTFLDDHWRFESPWTSTPRTRPSPDAPFWSCLLANTNKIASFNSSSSSMACSSCCATFSRSLSGNTTKMIASVFG